MTLVLLHGFMGSAAGMGSLAEAVAERTGGEAVAIDLVGHGEAPKPSAATSYTMPAVVERAAAQLSGFSAQPIDLFGYSMGGRVALTLALTHPHLVKRLVLLGASPGLQTEAERAERMESDHRLADALETDGIEAFVDHWLSLPMFEGLHTLGEEWFTSYRAERLAGDPVGFANSLRSMGTGAMAPLHDRLGDLAPPTLFLAGGNDHKFCLLGTSMAAQVRQGTFVGIDGAGHAAHLEVPELVADAIAGFLAP